MTKKQVTLELHFLTLREYYKTKRIPRGMRSSLQPTLFMQDVDFRSRFEKLSNQYAFDFMIMNLEFLKKELVTISERIKEVDLKLRTVSTEEDCKKKFFDKQSLFLCKFKTDLQETKRRKWHRDQTDYEGGYVYSWNSEKGNSFQRRNKKPRDGKKDMPPSHDGSTFLGKDQTQTSSANGEPGGEGDGETGVARNTRQRTRPTAQRTPATKKKNA